MCIIILHILYPENYLINNKKNHIFIFNDRLAKK